MRKFVATFIIGFAAITAAAQMPSHPSTDAIRAAMAKYEYSHDISLIDSALVRRDTADTEALRTLSLMKARCQKRLYKFGEACATLGPVAFMEDVEVMGELADTYASDGKLDDALGTYYTLVSQQPGNLFFRLQVLGLFNRMGSWNDCIAEGKAALQIDSLPQILSIVGHAYSKTGQADSSLVYYGKALKKYKEAADDFSKAWQIDSSQVMLAANYGTARFAYLKPLEKPDMCRAYSYAHIGFTKLAEICRKGNFAHN